MSDNAKRFIDETFHLIKNRPSAREVMDKIVAEREAETIPVPRDQLLQLLALAEDFLLTKYSEFRNDPSDENRGLMLSLYRLAGKDVPPAFFSYFGWDTDALAR